MCRHALPYIKACVSSPSGPSEPICGHSSSVWGIMAEWGMTRSLNVNCSIYAIFHVLENQSSSYFQNLFEACLGILLFLHTHMILLLRLFSQFQGQQSQSADIFLLPYNRSLCRCTGHSHYKPFLQSVLGKVSRNCDAMNWTKYMNLPSGRQDSPALFLNSSLLWFTTNTITSGFFHHIKIFQNRFCPTVPFFFTN